jgi:hypothetical protein
MVAFFRKLPSRSLWLLLAAILALGVTFQNTQVLGIKEVNGVKMTHYNNYVIFKNAHHHLLTHQVLYAHYPNEQYDLYKYSPAFALCFGVFAHLPDFWGLLGWNLLNALVLVLGLFSLRHLDPKRLHGAMLLILPELLSSTQNSQANALMAGLMMLAVGFLERDQVFWAIGCIMASVYIKLFGIVAFSLFLFYPGKVRMVVYALLWALLLFFVPLLVIGLDLLVSQYRSWFELLGNDHDRSFGFSLLGWMHTWFGWNPNKLLLQAVGVGLFCLPLLRWKLYSRPAFRYDMLALVLLWVILFNHMSESPTYVIAACGAALCFVNRSTSKVNYAAMMAFVLVVSLSGSDLMPALWRKEWVYPYVLKTFPVVLLWVYLMMDLLGRRSYATSPQNRAGIPGPERR